MQPVHEEKKLGSKVSEQLIILPIWPSMSAVMMSAVYYISKERG